MSATQLLLVEDETAHAELILRAFRASASDVVITVAHSLGEARAAITHSVPDVALIDSGLPDGCGIDLLAERRAPVGFPGIIMTCHGDEVAAVSAMKAGAVDYLVKTDKVLAEMPRIVEQTLREWSGEVGRDAGAAPAREGDGGFRDAFDEMPGMFLTLDAGGVVRSVNRFGAERLGYEVGELAGSRITILEERERREELLSWLSRCIQEDGTVSRRESRFLRKDGSAMWVRCSARAVTGRSGEPLLLLACEDATTAHTLTQQLSHRATHDSLTGLVNRWEFERRLQRVLDTSRHGDSEHALCYLDLDRFKVINDTCGHVAGDELLRQVGAQLGAHVRRRDTLARLGGDEFGAILEHCSLAQAKRVAGALRRAVSDYRFHWQDQPFDIGVSIGLVAIDASCESLASVMSAADAACYAAKDEGRDRVHVYDSADRSLHRRRGELRWVSRIGRALDQQEFKLYGQVIKPLEGNGTGALGYELLLRLEEPNGNLVTPGQFMPAALRYNLASRIDRWVISNALDWIHRRPDYVEQLSMLSINLSGASLADDDFVGMVVNLLDKNHKLSEKICFEISEAAAVSHLTSAAAFITSLRELGCRFALDDFGGRMSSFAYLRTLPVDFVKINGLLIRDVAEDPVDFAMVRSINEIGQIMGKRTIAPFVESDAILQKLKSIGVDYAQGFHLGRPQRLERMA